MAIENKHLEGVKISLHGPIIYHIFFTNDILIFLKAEKTNCRNLVQIIKAYCLATGVAVKLKKSRVFVGANTSAAVLRSWEMFSVCLWYLTWGLTSVFLPFGAYERGAVLLM